MCENDDHISINNLRTAILQIIIFTHQLLYVSTQQQIIFRMKDQIVLGICLIGKDMADKLYNNALRRQIR